MKTPAIAAFLVVACTFGAIGGYVGLKRTEPRPALPSVVDELFATSMENSSGQSHKLSQWKGKTLVVNFWATWCNPCIKEMPELSALQEQLSSKNIQIIGIGVDSARNISEFSSKYAISYPLYVADTRGVELGRKFGNQSGGLPFTVLIGPSGQVQKTYLGRLDFEALKRDLAKP